MKKIIATVLAMVMALALCTTAFAVTYGKVYEFKDNKSWSEVDMTGKTISYTSASETKQDGKFVKGTIGYYTITNADSTKVYLAEVGANDATYRVTVDGEVKNLKTFSDVTKISYTLKGSEVTFGGTVAKCGDVYKGTGLGTNETLYVDVDGDYYKSSSTSTTYMLADGVVVPVVAATKGAAADYTVVAHGWETVASNLAADGYVTGTAKCTRCGQTANITSKKGDIPTGAKSEFLTLPMFGTTKTVWVYWTDGVNAGGSGSTSGATSPKTFDAGIALYAAMALTSVAGSAVVIGKKKEF